MNDLIKVVTIGLVAFIGIAGLIVLVGLLLSWPVLLLWNGCLVGTVAGISPLSSIWHAWGILILCGFLFKGVSASSSES